MPRRKRRRALTRAAWAGLIVAVVAPVLTIVVLRFVPPPLTPFMVVRRLTSGTGWNYRWMPLAAMSPYIPRAVIAAEDTRFVQHHGFDWTEMESALAEQRHGRRLRGASTISMQCARSLFLWPGRSVVRKGIEAYLTVLLEALWPKSRILEVYLNIVEWGDGTYGCEAAARRQLGVSCAALDAEAAARLAAILPNPHRWSASRPGPYVRRRVLTILERMPQVAVPPTASIFRLNHVTARP
jgi:monofunctional biosynthetic peptidoglycan transglycosylase